MIVERFVDGPRERWVAHSGPKSAAYIYCRGGDQPANWAEWNVLPTTRFMQEGTAADREWKRITEGT